MEQLTQTRVRASTAATRDSRSAMAIHGIAEAIDARSADLNILFVSPRHDLAAVQKEWAALDAGPTIACTTAGEIHHAHGYHEGGIVGASLRGVDVCLRPLPALHSFDVAQAQSLAEDVSAFLRASRPSDMVFGIVLMDGLCMREELVVASLAQALPGVPLVGGSAGDELAFRRTQILVEGSFRSDAGVLALVRTPSPAHVFMGHHFESTGKRLVVTAADPAKRRVYEFNGRPARAAYLDAIGAAGEELTQQTMALHPLMLGLCGRTFVRSIAAEAPDGALDLYCAIEEGLVLQIGRPSGLVDRLTGCLGEVAAAVPDVELVVTFDCILRRLELQHSEAEAAAAAAITDHPLIGFSTYGEVYGGLHVNQTLTGIAFGR